jgi:hypothetical protein
MADTTVGLVGAVGAAESAASAAVGGLGPDSTAAELTQVSLTVNKFNIISTAVSAILKADAEAKTAAARGIKS